MKLTDKTFDDYIKDGEKMVICTAGYCKACERAIRTLEASSQSIGIVILTDRDSVNTMTKLNIKKVPTIIDYRDGKEQKRAVGTAALFDMTRRGSQ